MNMEFTTRSLMRILITRVPDNKKGPVIPFEQESNFLHDLLLRQLLIQP
jgi:hypothetical protein